MASVPAPLPETAGPMPSPTAALTESHTILSRELRRLTRVATVITVISSPSVFYWFHHHNGMGVGKALILTFLSCAAFRGVVDILVRKVIPWPSLFGTDDPRLREEDIVNRRRWWTWSSVLKRTKRFAVVITFFFALQYFIHWWRGDAINPIEWTGTATAWWVRFSHLFSAGNLPLLAQVFFLFIANMLLFMGPLLAMGIMQIKAFEPGDAEWGVKLEDVRGQAEAKEEIRRIVTLWQSGEVFEKAGGKRERGLLFLGSPGTGKTMMAKAIATGFNSPFVTIPGSGFAQAFIGIDAVIVRVMAARAKRLARKWGGNCIVFIDEIDAVGMRRSALGPGGQTMNPLDDFTPKFYGPFGALNPSGDVIVENAAWRDYMFAIRADEPRAPYPGWYGHLARIVNQGIFPGMGGGGQLALNQLLVVMDGVDNPPFLKRFRTNRVNTFLDAIYILPRRLGKRAGRVFCLLVGLGASFMLLEQIVGLSGGSAPVQALVPRHSTNWTIFLALLSIWTLWGAIKGFRSAHETGTVSLRLRQASATGNQIYFIGATNVPVGNLDPALTRPGRMGRHVVFRTPTKEDRKDIFDLYLGKVAHNPELDSPRRRDEIARITNGYSPAEIDQICSMALTAAHHSGRAYFEWDDLVEAMTVNESGTAVNVNFIEEDVRATAIHEAGHAASAHVYRPEVESSRLSIRMRGRSGGHHQSFEKEERFGKFQSMMFGELIHGVGAMAAELAFYGENSNGVGGDMAQTTWLASTMVGGSGMSPLPIDLHGKTFPDEDEEQSYQRVLRRFEDIGLRMMNRTAAGFDAGADPRKRAYAAQFLGQALVMAYNLVIENKDKVQAVADAVIDQREIFGDELVRLLDEQRFVKPEIDWTNEETWPKLMNWSRDPREMRLLTEGGEGDGPGRHH
jgi:ATP-dependent Zn protease